MNKHSAHPTGSTFSLDLHGAIVRRTSLRNANLKNADLRNADCTNVDFRGADFEGARLDNAILRGAFLQEATNLTVEQIKSAIIDTTTELPAYISRDELK